MKLFSRADQSFLGVWWWTVDRGMLAATLILMVMGVMLVTTASPSVAHTIGVGQYHFLVRHVVFLIPSLVLLIGTSMLSHRQIRRIGTVLFIGTMLAMVVVLFAGFEVKGARRWIHVLGFSIQPSEFAKPLFLLVAAWLMSLQKTQTNFPGYVATAGLYFLVVALLLLQPDFGMTFVLSFSWGVQIFLAGLPLRFVFGLIGTALMALVIIYFSFSHVQSRIDRFINPDAGDNYQVERSLEAFQNGGLLGTGPGQGTVKHSLPDAHADFIFSVAGEELGAGFILVLISIYAFIVMRGFSRLLEREDFFVVLAAGGLLAMLGLQAFVHMGSALHLLPAKGMTLPFISYGGSSLLSVSLSMGMVLALMRRKSKGGVSKASLSV